MIARLWGRSRTRETLRVRSGQGSSGSSPSRRAQLAAAVAAFALATSLGSIASAQTWSQKRERPPLFEIVAVDESAQPLWPFGQEDLAKDGIGNFAVDEAAVDLRSVYADTRPDGLWLRAYVASDVAPVASAVMFFFLDNDADTSTGGKADADTLFEGWSADPSSGGYEVAVGMRGDETLLGVWLWDTKKQQWTLQSEKPVLVTLETGKARDPLRLSGEDHGYFQITLDVKVVELGDACTGPLFVRSWNDAMGARAFGDSIDVTMCKPRLNAYGDPEILHTDECTADSSCPANGKCRDRVCVFEYTCSQDDECRDDERCMGSVCVRVVDKTCASSADCEGLVCVSDKCTACGSSGDRACAAGYVCTPNGSCIKPGGGIAGRSGGGSGKTGSDGAGGSADERVRGGAFTCSAFGAAPERSVPWLSVIGLGFALIWIRRRRRRGLQRRSSSWLLALFAFTGSLALVLSHSHPLHAEDVDVQRFTPYTTSGGFLQTEGTQTRYPIDPFSLGAWLSFAYQPLVVVRGSDETGKVVGAQVGLDLTAAYAFANWFELGAHVPLSYLSGDDLSAAALGDLRLVPKFTFLRDDRDGIGIGLITELRLPTHTNEFSGGARMLAGAPRFLVSHRFGLTGFRLGLDLGVLLREATHYRNVTAASEIQTGVGLGYRFDGGRAPVELLIDWRTGVGLAESDAEEVSMELMGGAAVDLTPEWKFHGAAGLGLLEGFGVPTFRVLAGVRWEPSPNDPDHDGLGTSKALLQKQAENLDPNATQPPEEPGAVANVDAVDDQERAQAIRDGYDACPTLPEDIDGDEDEDGCPEGDADGDGVLDYLDQCEGEEETINGFKDDDGCPDEGPAQIIIENGKITILETIRFRPNSSEIETGSYPIMDQIALALRKHKELDRVEVGGHTDSTGRYEYNMRLSRARARSVRQYLLARGIPPGRLSARGYGPDKPIGDNNTDEGRTKNRRVEFIANP